ncbi:MAG: hypothetical protein ACRYHQ_33945, partial [Janthinobacterium lividum]
MTVGLLVAPRRRLLGATVLLGTAPCGAGAAAAQDEELLAAAVAFCALERRMQGLIEGPDSIADDGARDVMLAPLWDEQEPHLDLLVRLRARSLGGHRARAAAFALWDGGEIA